MMKRLFAFLLIIAYALYLCFISYIQFDSESQSRELTGERVFSQHDSLQTPVQYELAHWGKSYKPNRIMCLVPTLYPENEHRIKRISETWGPLCDGLLWGLASDSKIPKNVSVGKVVILNTTFESKLGQHTWQKVMHMFLHADNITEDYEWFIKIDDDAFLSVVNLREFLAFYNPDVPHYLGHPLLHMWMSLNIVFNSGGAGYVLSKSAVSLLSEELRTIPKSKYFTFNKCVDRPGAMEDVMIGVCLKGIGIIAENTLDGKGRKRFLPFHLVGHIRYKRKTSDWLWMHTSNETGDLDNCCVPNIITAHPFKTNGKRDTADHIRMHRMFNLGEIADNAKNDERVVVEADPDPIPPKPKLFLYDNTSLRYAVDEYRNIPAHAIPNGQKIYKGKK